MSKLIVRLLVGLALGWTGSAGAALMPPVSVDDRLWLQPLDFVNNSWNDIAAVCDPTTGACNGSLGGNDVTGWTWAGIPDLIDLFTAFGIPGTQVNNQWSVLVTPATTTWAPLFLGSFLATNVYPEVTGYLRYQVGFAAVADDIPTFAPLLFDGAQVTASPGGNANASSEIIGGWFYRTVPSPATVSLLCLGLAALASTRPRRVM
jgi:hypothetical protein